MTTIKLILGLDPFEDWPEEDFEKYDEDASRQLYEECCCDAIYAQYPNIDIEELYPYQLQPYMTNWDKFPDDYEEICLAIADICLEIWSEPDDWLVERI